jgi:hypothetical protein
MKKAVTLTTNSASRSARFPLHASKDKMLIALRGVQQFGSFCQPYIRIAAFTLLARVHSIIRLFERVFEMASERTSLSNAVMYRCALIVDICPSRSHFGNFYLAVVMFSMLTGFGI